MIWEQNVGFSSAGCIICLLHLQLHILVLKPKSWYGVYLRLERWWLKHTTIPYHTLPYHTIPYHTIPYVIWGLFEVGPLVAQPHDRHASSLTSGDERRILRGDFIEWRRGRDGEKWKYEISREAKGGAGVVGKRRWVKDKERRLVATHSEKRMQEGSNLGKVDDDDEVLCSNK